MIITKQRRRRWIRRSLLQLSLFLISSLILRRTEGTGDDIHHQQATIITTQLNQQQQQQQQQKFLRSQQQNETNETTTTIKKVSSSSTASEQQQQQQSSSITQPLFQQQSRQLSVVSDFLTWVRQFLNPKPSTPPPPPTSSPPPPTTTTLPPAGTPYTLYPASKIATTLLALQQKYPNFIQVTTSQKEYGLPVAYDNAELDCPYDGTVKGCLNYYAVLQDYIVNPIGSDTSNALPTVLFSGTVHGNERVGPTAVLEATKLLLLASSCETLLANNTAATTCRTDIIKSYGITDEQRQWLARLVTTRRIIVVPTANALGYYKNVREEGPYDVNRDFPFDLLNNNCMKTIAARTLNELFRTYIIQLSLTFHAGTEVIAYEWGATSYNGYNSPDDIGQNRIVKSMQLYAGQFGYVPYYDIGQSNSIVYPVRGGMEDWAYAGSWDPTKVPQCIPTTYGGYNASKTSYGPIELRDFNILVETSIDKTPPSFLLGNNRNILDPISSGNGHVPRNIRLTLLGTELVEPYILVKAVNGQNRTTDLIPGVSRSGQSCRTSSNQVVPITKASNPIVSINWIVGGALVVDSTKLWYSKRTDVPTLNCSTQPPATITNTMKNGTIISPSTGVGRFTTGGTPTLFQGTIDLSQYNTGDEIVILIEAAVDQQWKQNINRTRPNIVPQSHIVNIRTNTSWYYKNTAGLTVQGRTRWFSLPPITIVIQ